MRIGELAAAVGVTTRAVRHAHPPGLLPEPAHSADDYRRHTPRHAVPFPLPFPLPLPLTRRLTELDARRALRETAPRKRRARPRAPCAGFNPAQAAAKRQASSPPRLLTARTQGRA